MDTRDCRVCGGPKEDHGILNGYHDKHDYRPVLKAGDHVSFPYLGRETTGIIRTFQWQDWSDEPVALIDLDKPGSARSPRGASLGIRIEQRLITGKV